MAIRYQYDPAENILHTYCTETLSAADILGHFDKVKEDLSIKKDYIELVYLDQTSEIGFTADQANKYPRHFANMKDKTGIRATIFIGQSILHFGIGRMLENIHDIHNVDDDIRVVRSREEATEQIKEIRTI